MRILVTGAGGFLGRHLLPQLLAAGHAVACLTRQPEHLPASHGPLHHATPDRQGILALCDSFRPQVVVHIAAVYRAEHRYEDIAELVDGNLAFSAHLLDAMSTAGCDTLVLAGTSWQHYGGADYRPVNLYAAMKQAVTTLAEYYRDSAGLRLLELHLYDSYGEDDDRPRLLQLLQRSARDGHPLALSPGEQALHLVHVEDVARGFVLACSQVAAQAPGSRSVYRLPSAAPVTLRELVDIFDAADPQHPARVVWGERPYRRREVFQPWEGADILPGWAPTIDLANGMERLRLRQLP